MYLLFSSKTIVQTEGTLYLIFLFSADGLVVSHLPFGPTAYFTLSNTVMRHDIPNIGTMSEAYPHLIFHNFNSKLGERVSVALSVFCSFDMTLQ